MIQTRRDGYEKEEELTLPHSILSSQGRAADCFTPVYPTIPEHPKHAHLFMTWYHQLRLCYQRATTVSRHRCYEVVQEIYRRHVRRMNSQYGPLHVGSASPLRLRREMSMPGSRIVQLGSNLWTSLSSRRTPAHPISIPDRAS